jgi:integrase
VDCFDGRAIHVIAKGDHEVTHFLTPSTKRALDEWSKIRRGLRWNHKFLFASPVSGTPLRPWHLWYLFVGRKRDAGLCKLAGIRPFSVHDIRRSFATKMFSGGLGTSVVQKLMHHANQETTTRYDLRGDAELDKERLKVADYGAGP